MFARRCKPVVFGGPSIAYLPSAVLDRIEIKPPARRGDLLSLLTRRPGRVVLIDGLFSSNMAVPPAECRQLLKGGWTMVGAASMGALRASELWSLGMIGLGEIYTLFRLGTLHADADVAVALHPDSYQELTLSLVHIRSLLATMRRRDEITAAFARKLLAAVREVHFLERAWAVCAERWTRCGIDGTTLASLSALARDPGEHPKIRDAHSALSVVLAGTWSEFVPVHATVTVVRPRSGIGTAKGEPDGPRICPACHYQTPATAIFCPNCASISHEMAH
jgi:hypothetical protein